jgi:predicted  nucleic acid-binding Zn-ribbon protein
MQIDLYKQYVDLEKEFKALEEKKQALRDQIVSAMRAEKIEKDATEFGTFTIAKKTSWTYSEAVKKLEDKVKIAKVREQEKGVAKSEVIEYLRFSEKKDETL